jgi:hypothetical protein
MKSVISNSLKLTLTVLFISSLSFTACSNKEEELNRFLNKIETQYENIAIDLGEAYWNFYSAEGEADLKTPKDKFYNLLINDTLNTLIETWYPKRAEIKDSMLTRRVEKWHDVLLSAKVEYNAEILELRNDLEKMLEMSNKEDETENDLEAKMN